MAASAPRDPEPIVRLPSAEPDPADLADWSKGTAGLGRMPARLRLQLTDGIAEMRARATAELNGKELHLEQLRYAPEAMLDTDVAERLGFRVLEGVTTDPPAPMLIDRLDPRGHTILYGTGGVGKGSLAAWWITQLVDAGHRILVIDYENHPDEWSRRVHGLGGDRQAVGWVGPWTAAWRGPRGAIWTQARELAAIARAWGATCVFIDSIIPACGATDPLNPEAAGQYAGALELLDVPVVSLAHVTKGGSLAYPFGSVFWHNLARVTWSLKRDGEGAAILRMGKANNYARAARQRVEPVYLDGHLRSIGERPYQAVLADRIDEVLTSGALTPVEVTRLLNEELEEDQDEVKRNSVIHALRRGAGQRPPRYDVKDGRWSRFEP